MMVRLMERPTPMPVCFVVKNGWNRLRERIACKAGPGIGNGNFDHVMCGPGVRGNQLTVRRDSHRFQRIAEQVDQHLLNLTLSANTRSLSGPA